MADDESRLPVKVLRLCALAVGSRESNGAPRSDKVGIDDPALFFLEEGIEGLEDLLADQFIITVHRQVYLIRFAELVGCVVQIRHRHDLLLIASYCQLFLRDEVGLGVFLNLFAGVVSGPVVNKKDAVVGVVLLQDGADILEVSILGHVVVAGHHHTKGQLLILRYFIFVFVVLFLLHSIGVAGRLVLQLDVLLPNQPS